MSGGERIPVYCALCVSRCGALAVVEGGRFVALEPDPSHPTGKALCAKGRAAPEGPACAHARFARSAAGAGAHAACHIGRDLLRDPRASCSWRCRSMAAM
jgi:hypothetical protein